MAVKEYILNEAFKHLNVYVIIICAVHILIKKVKMLEGIIMSRKLLFAETFAFMFVLFCSISFGQINVSETFQKTLKKIAKEKIKTEVIAWIAKQDPTSGIIARDLIAQLIDGKNEQTLLRSTTNVVATSMFLCGIKNRVNELIDSTQEVIDQGISVGWTREQLVAYSSLYYYYSERLKYHLYVSPEILKMSQEKSKIESFISKDDRKWTTIVSGKLIGLRRIKKDISMDVRFLEAMDNALWVLISDREHYSIRIDSMYASLLHAYPKDSNFHELLSTLDISAKQGKFVESLFDIYKKNYDVAQSNISVFSTVSNQLSRDSSIKESFPSNILINAYGNLVYVAHYEFVNQEQMCVAILEGVKNLLDFWMTKGREDGWKLDYMFSLAGTGYGGSGSNTIDFTILDQVRFVKNYETTKIFIYCGGFFDPLLKSTVNKSGPKYYLIGGGWGWNSTYIAVSGGIEYPDIVIRNIRMAITIGYEVPVSDLLDQ